MKMTFYQNIKDKNKETWENLETNLDHLDCFCCTGLKVSDQFELILHLKK